MIKVEINYNQDMIEVVDNFAKNLYTELGFVENGNSKIIRDREYIEMIYENRN